jgi:NADP-dependent 3-hydroxy acid dehydrogenase YdfG
MSHAAVKKAAERFGSLDILVNNAGVIDPIARLEDSDPDIWNQASISTSRASITACAQRYR